MVERSIAVLVLAMQQAFGPIEAKFSITYCLGNSNGI